MENGTKDNLISFIMLWQQLKMRLGK